LTVKQTIYEIDSAFCLNLSGLCWINAETMGVKFVKELETIKNAQRPKQNFYELGYESKNQKKYYGAKWSDEGFRCRHSFGIEMPFNIFFHTKPYWGGLESGVTGIYSEVITVESEFEYRREYQSWLRESTTVTPSDNRFGTYVPYNTRIS